MDPPAGPLRPLAPREPPIGPPAAMLRPSAAGPHHSKPHERPPVGVERSKSPQTKTMIKYIKGSSKVIMKDVPEHT
jgi:hypothetical protein